MEASVGIKICGIKEERTAMACSDLGADAVGFVFYGKSPRNISLSNARRIIQHLPDTVLPVGVFVDEPYDSIIRAVDITGIRGVQLHGCEKPDLCRKLVARPLKVFKALFLNQSPTFDDASRYDGIRFLAESRIGPLPGGNALSWDWKKASDICLQSRVVLAGGLNPFNVERAIREAKPGAVDVSSGVESEPGVKDMKKIGQFIRRVRGLSVEGRDRRKKEEIF